MQAGDARAWFWRWVAAEHGRFAVWLPLLMAAGVAWYDALTFEPPAWLGAAACLAALAAAWRGRRPWLRFPAGAVAAVALGMAAAQLATWRAPPLVALPRGAALITGRVVAVEPLPNGRRVTIAAPSLDGAPALPRSVRLRLRAGDETALAAGDVARVRALLSPPAPPAYPGAWDLQRDAFYAGMGGSGFALGPAERVARGAPDGLAALLQRAREAIAARVAASLPAERAAIAAALLTGSTTGIAEADRAAFRNSGLAHLLAIAGLHIGIVMAWVFAATRLGLALSERAALFWPLKAIAALVALAAGGGYMLLTGAHVPILRSFAMAALVTLGVIVGRRALSLRGWALAMAAIVLIAPWEVTGVSFQMSFAAVLALIAGYEALRPWLARLYGHGGIGRRFLGHAVALALTSALAGTASAPFGAYHFGQVQLYYVAANMVAVPLTALWVMPLGMLSLPLMAVHAEAPVLAAMGWGIEGVLWIARTVAAWPAAVVPVPQAPGWGLVAVAAGIAWLGIWRSRVRLAGVPLIVLALASPWLVRQPDVLVSADARLIGIRTAQGVYVQKVRGGARFTEDAWLRMWAAPEAMPLGPDGAPALPCAPEGCRVRLAGREVVLARETVGCGPLLVVSANPVRLTCSGTAVIDRFSVYRRGAMAAWVGPAGVRVVSDRDVRGRRPWVIEPGQPSGPPPGLRMAPAE